MGVPTDVLSKIGEEAYICLLNLQFLKNFLKQNMEGKSPDVSLIIGMIEEPADKSKAEGPLELLQQIRKLVSELRELTANYYAEQVGNACAVQ